MIDGFQLLIQDHREVERLFDDFETTGDPMIVREICFTLVLHTEAEEAVLYPALRSLVTDGAELASRAEQGRLPPATRAPSASSRRR